MRKKFYLCLLILFVIISQGIAVLSDENIEDSTDLHIRKKRLVDKSRNGGLPVHRTMTPYIVNILKNGISHCSGSILHPAIILTVTPCVWLPNHARFSVLSGSSMRDQGTHHNITNRRILSESKLVILIIYPPINLHQGINERIDVFNGALPPNQYGIFSGWGSTGLDRRHNPIFPEQLMQTRLPIIPLHECIDGHNGDIPITFTQLCTLDRTRRRGTSVGDEDGALVYQRRLLGVLLHTSMEIGVYPDVFVDLNVHMHQFWIASVIRNLRF